MNLVPVAQVEHELLTHPLHDKRFKKAFAKFAIPFGIPEAKNRIAANSGSRVNLGVRLERNRFQAAVLLLG